jgi:H+/Cl- antiporter ClcA
MNPLYKIVKGILDLGRSIKKVELPKSNIHLEKYYRRRFRIFPILAGAVGVLIAVGIMNVVLKTVMESTQQYNVSDSSAHSITTGSSWIWILVVIPFLVIPIMIIRSFVKEEG